MIEVANIRAVKLPVPGGVYIGRDTRISRDTIFGNPIKLGKPCRTPGGGGDVGCGRVHHRNEVESGLRCYARWLAVQLRLATPFARAVLELPTTAVLICHCTPAACHGHVLADVRSRTDPAWPLDIAYEAAAARALEIAAGEVTPWPGREQLSMFGGAEVSR